MGGNAWPQHEQRSSRINLRRSFRFFFDVDFAIVSLVSVVITLVESSLNGFGAYLPCLLQVFSGLFIVSGPLACIALALTILLRRSELTARGLGLRFALMAVLLSLGVFFFVFPGGSTITNLAMRVNVSMNGGVEQLRAWADTIMERPVSEVVVDANSPGFSRIRPELFSEQVEQIGKSVHLVTTDQGQCVLIRVGGGGFIEFDWGVLILSPQTQVNYTANIPNVYCWDARVYGYVGRSWNRLLNPNPDQ